MNDIVTIIVPVYNVEDKILRCVDSILKQTYTFWELILVNDGSKDNSGLLCNNIALKDNRIKVLHKKNGGVSSARNFGIQNANKSSKYIVFCDSDDTISKFYLEELINGMKDSDLSFCGIKHIYNNTPNILEDNNIGSVYFKNIHNNKDWYMLWETGLLNSPCNKMYSLNLILNKNLSFKNIPMLEDIEFNVNYFRHITSAIYIKKEMYNYWHNEGSLTTKVHEEDYINYIKLHEELLSYIPQQYHIYINRFVYHQYLAITLKFIRKGIYDLPKKYLKNKLINNSIKSYKPKNIIELIQYNLIKLKLLHIYKFIFYTLYNKL